MEVVEKRIDEIRPYKNNPRKNDNAVDAVANSIKEFGFKVPIVVDKNNEIVCGHTRYKAAKKLELDVVPCIQAVDLSDEQIKAFRLADNKTAELSEWDMDALEEELAKIEHIDIDSLGFEKMEENEKDKLEEDLWNEDLVEEPVSQKGDMFILGEHVLLCGDSTSEKDIEKVMGGGLCNLVITDPPYNVNVSNSEGKTIENDNLSDKEFYNFLTKAFMNMAKVMDKDASFYVWYASKEAVNFINALNSAGLSVRQQLIWVKNHFTFGRQDYKWMHEPCLYGWKDGASHYFIEEYNNPTVYDDIELIEDMSKSELKELAYKLLDTNVPVTAIREDKPLKDDIHPTMKPIKIVGKHIANSSKKNDIVLDPFGGSGTTLMACEQIGRKARIIEYDPRYVDAIINRWEKYTGKTAQKINEKAVA